MWSDTDIPDISDVVIDSTVVSATFLPLEAAETSVPLMTISEISEISVSDAEETMARATRQNVARASHH